MREEVERERSAAVFCFALDSTLRELLPPLALRDLWKRHATDAFDPPMYLVRERESVGKCRQRELDLKSCHSIAAIDSSVCALQPHSIFAAYLQMLQLRVDAEPVIGRRHEVKRENKKREI